MHLDLDNMIWHNTIQFNLDKTRSDNEQMYMYIFIYIYIYIAGSQYIKCLSSYT